MHKRFFNTIRGVLRQPSPCPDTSLSTRERVKSSAGFTLLYAMVVVSIVLTVSSGIMVIMVKELKLAGYGRESQVAYYAAESGAECALYWVALTTIDGVKTGSIRCGDKDIPNVVNTFRLDLSPYPGCADVTIIPGSPIIIESRGYNTCATSKLRVERGIQVTY